ncbi:hypothetical protein LLG95_02000 [bacterium]|nr:hypothetical protein [bacterium]
MRKMLVQVSLAVMLLAGVVSCNKQSGTEGSTAAGNNKPAPALPTMAVMKAPKFGISTPNASTHNYRLEPGKPLELKGWYIADEPLDVTYELNGESYEARSMTRGDVKKNYPDYKVAQGWAIIVPADKLKPENKLMIHYGDKTWPMTVSVK